MNEIISVIFNDGSRWDNLTLDGSSLVSKKPLDPSKIDNCPENLKIVDSEGEIIFMFDYALISSYGGPNEIGEYYVAIYPLTSEKMRECEVNSKLDYLSLMTGIDLENEIEKVRTISNERGGGHSPKYTTLMRYFRIGLWDEAKMRAAVDKGWITMLEFETITRSRY